jgi:RNA polymerase sigma factor (sigma-70 family)
VKTARAQMILGCLRKALQPRGDGLTDGQLLGQFVARRDEAAFAALVRRHGPMVFGVCRRILRHNQDAEDAFQATFLVLARKASRVAKREAVGSWLYGVAYRASLDARASRLRRKAKETQVEDMPHPLVMPKEDQNELLAVLDRELARLPEKYRLPVVLCELEGRSRKEAARQLGLPEGTLSSRLATARKTLARRMAAHGPAVTAASLTALFASEAGAAVVPGPLVASTVRAASGVVSAGVVALAEGVLKAMLLTKIKAMGLVLLLAASVGAVTLTYRTASAEAQPAVKALRSAAKAATPEQSDLEALRLEVEALRVSLQATRERVKALETTVQALQKHGAVSIIGPGSLEVDGLSVKVGSAAPESPPPQGANSKPPQIGEKEKYQAAYDGLRLEAITAQARWVTAAAELEAAAKKLAQDSKNKEAMEALDRAVKQLKSLTKPKPSENPKANELLDAIDREVKELERLDESEKRLTKPKPPEE